LDGDQPSEVQAGLPVDHHVPASEHAAPHSQRPRGERLPRRRGHGARYERVLQPVRRLRIVPFVLWLVPACENVTGTAGSGGGGGGTIPVVSHVFVVVEENTDYADVTSSSMPYLDSLAGAYGLATQYYADTHPSIGNYFTITVGDTITNNDSYAQTVSSDNIIRH